MAVFLERFEYASIEGLRAGVYRMQLEPAQLTSNPFRGRLLVAGLDTARLTLGAIEGDARVSGPLSSDTLTLGIFLETGPRSRVRDFETRRGDIGVFPAGADHDARHNTRTRYATLVLPQSDIVERAAIEYPWLPEAFWKNAAMYRPPPAQAGRIVTLFRDVERALDGTPRLLEAPHARNAMLDDMSGALLFGYASADAEPVARRRTFIAASRLVKSAEDYLHNHLERSVREPELCRHLGVSVSSLHRAFHDVFGLPPVTYLRRWRLNQVRQRLVNPAHADAKVTDAALRFGFWQLGRFARHYQALFGELPSQTLANNEARRAA